MTKHFCTPKQTLALEDLGFNKPCLIYTNIYSYQAPLKSQAFEFFREKFNKVDYPEFDYENQKWFCHSNYQVHKTYFNTYEEAENACIDKLIEITQAKQ